jgi:hypothetical protein
VVTNIHHAEHPTHLRNFLSSVVLFINARTVLRFPLLHDAAADVTPRRPCRAEAEALANKTGLKFYRVCVKKGLNVGEGEQLRAVFVALWEEQNRIVVLIQPRTSVGETDFTDWVSIRVSITAHFL